MALDADQLATLKTELETDPTGLGYGPDHSTDAADADLLNERRASIQLFRDDLDAQELKDEIVLADHIAKCDTEAKRAWFALVLDNGIPVQDPNGAVRQGITSLFAGTQTLSNFAAVAQRDGSRAEQLFALNVWVTPSDVANARNS